MLLVLPRRTCTTTLHEHKDAEQMPQAVLHLGRTALQSPATTATAASASASAWMFVLQRDDVLFRKMYLERNHAQMHDTPTTSAYAVKDAVGAILFQYRLQLREIQSNRQHSRC